MAQDEEIGDTARIRTPSLRRTATTRVEAVVAETGSRAFDEGTLPTTMAATPPAADFETLVRFAPPSSSYRFGERGESPATIGIGGGAQIFGNQPQFLVAAPRIDQRVDQGGEFFHSQYRGFTGRSF